MHTEGESRPIPFKNGLSVLFGSDDSGTPSWVSFSTRRIEVAYGALRVRNFPFLEVSPFATQTPDSLTASVSAVRRT